MEYARVENGKILEFRTLHNIPTHKAHIWTPVVTEGDGSHVDHVIDRDVVRRVLSHPPQSTAPPSLTRTLEEKLASLERRLAMGLQMTDAMFDLQSGKTPETFRYPELAAALKMSPTSTIDDWRLAIKDLRS
jgi:hypothetical protein